MWWITSRPNGSVNAVRRRRPGGGLEGISSSRPAPKAKDVVVGFDEDLNEIKKRLLKGSDKPLVLPIVGIGGIGKTTLAKLVYNDAFIREQFDIRGWVTMSQDYSVGSIASHLLDSMQGISSIGSNIPAEDEIRECLDRCWGRYLIVIDNLWSKKAWDDVRKLFPDKYGSGIILTTRSQDVAAYADLSNSFRVVRPLRVQDSWALLRNKVFGDQLCPLELEQAGREIAAQCRGLPLSIVVAAGLLSKIDRTNCVWKQIAESDGQLETIISLSYFYLPHHLKSCFLYMGGFPEDYEIRASELIKLWVAEGFVTCPHGSKSLEEEAGDCLEDLVERGLVLDTSRNFDVKIKSCGLHDVVRDFCIRQSQQETFLLPVLDYLPSPILRRHFLPLVLKNHKRVSVTWHDLDLKDSTHSSGTHAIICIPQKGYRPKGSVENFSLLKILHVLRRNDYWEWEPSQVFDLIHLTYLAANIPTSIVPPVISKLHNLQTLIIYRSEVRLPVEIWRLSQLRHLIAFSFHPLPHPEEASIPLTNLQTFSLATDFVCIEMIPNIQKLGICYSKEKFGESYRLGNLLRLEKLKLERHNSVCGSLNPVFPLSLKKLTLSGWKLPWRDMKIVGSLPNLQVLKLRKYACDGKRWETTEGEFVNLRLLLIDESNLQHWTAKSSHFPRLKCLMLLRCPDLFEIPIALGYIPTLELIEVDDRNQSLINSAREIEEKNRWNFNYNDLHVRMKRF